MATASPDVDQIRRRMAQIRRELHEDVQGVVAGAEAVTDWRRWIRNYPWAICGVAFAIGYFIVPRRRRETSIVHISSPMVGTAEAAPIAAAPTPRFKKRSLIWKGLGLIAPLVLRAGQNYALQYAEQWLAQRLQGQGGTPADLASMFGMMGTPPVAGAAPRSEPSYATGSTGP